MWNKYVCPKCHSAKNFNRHPEPYSNFHLLTLKFFRTQTFIIVPYFMFSSSKTFSCGVLWAKVMISLGRDSEVLRAYSTSEENSTRPCQTKVGHLEKTYEMKISFFLLKESLLSKLISSGQRSILPTGEEKQNKTFLWNQMGFYCVSHYSRRRCYKRPF